MLLAPFVMVQAQQLDMLRPAPEGIFIYLAGDLAIGKKVDSYTIERFEDKQWIKVAEIKSPATWNEFKSRVDLYQKDFPFSDLPSAQLLQKLWDKAFQAGTIDSMYMWSTSPILRLATATAYYDKQAPRDKAVSYRITVGSQKSKKPQVFESNPSKWPVYASFDSIKLEEKNMEKKIFYLKWKTTGNNPAPNFKVQYYDNKQLKTAEGSRTIYNVKETTYYIYQDSIKQAFSDRQFFMVPIDYLENIGNTSEITFVTSNAPQKRYFKTAKASTSKEMLGIRLSWRLNDARSLRSVDIYRSSNFDADFEKITSCPASDTVFTDLHVEPDKFYYYYLRANEMHGTEYVESSKFFDVGKDPLQPNAPIIDYAKTIPNGIELKITVNDINMAGVRVYRRKNYTDAFIPVSDLIRLKSGSIVWADTSSSLTGNQSFVYVAKAENTSYGLSEYSAEVVGSSGKTNAPREVMRVRAYAENKKVNLTWEDPAANDIAIRGYVVYRREKPDGKFKPVYAWDSISVSNMFVDSLIVPDKTYEYGIRTVDHFGGVSLKLAVTSIQTNPLIIESPGDLNALSSNGKVVLGWSEIQNNDLLKIKVYRYQRGKKPEVIATLSIKETGYTDTNLKKGELYFYYLTSVNIDNKESAPSKEISIVF
jgi:fibronectin type 3 domain-containing protein